MELEDCKPLTDAVERAHKLKIEGHDKWKLLSQS